MEEAKKEPQQYQKGMFWRKNIGDDFIASAEI